MKIGTGCRLDGEAPTVVLCSFKGLGLGRRRGFDSRTASKLFNNMMMDIHIPKGCASVLMDEIDGRQVLLFGSSLNDVHTEKTDKSMVLKRMGKSGADKGADLKKKLDKVFSQYIRLRDMLPGTTLFRCISCGKVYPISNADCGHYINRKHMSTRFSEVNCNAQCRQCNRFDEGNMSGYRLGLIGKYGEQRVAFLEAQKYETRKYYDYEYEALIAHYKKEIAHILEQRKLTIRCLTK